MGNSDWPGMRDTVGSDRKDPEAVAGHLAEIDRAPDDLGCHSTLTRAGRNYQTATDP